MPVLIEPPAPTGPDLLRTVNVTAGGRPVQRVSLEDPTAATFYKERGTFKIVPPTKTPNWARSGRRFSGQVQSGESMDNWTILATWWCKGANQNQVLENLEQLMAEIDNPGGLNPNEPTFMEWRPSGASFSSFYQLRGTGLYTPVYDWAKFRGVPMARVDLSWPVAPLAYGLPYDIYDGFGENSLSDYSLDKGSAPVYTASSFLQFASGETQLRHTIRGYAYDDVEACACYTIHSGSGSPEYLATIINAISETTYLEARWTTSTEKLEIFKVESGAATSVANKATSGGTVKKPVENGVYWLRVRIEGNAVTAELFTTKKPGPNEAPDYECTYVLSAAETLVFGEGRRGTAGVHVKTTNTTTVLESFEVLPYTYHNHNLPDEIHLRGVPGTAPAVLDLMVSTAAIGSAQGGGTSPLPWAWMTMGWLRKPRVWNMVHNGHFQEAAKLLGWLYSSGASASGTVLEPPVTTAGQPTGASGYAAKPKGVTWTEKGGPVLAAVGPNPTWPLGPPFMSMNVASATEGGNQFPIYHRFRKGVTYTLRFVCITANASDTITAILGNWLGTATATTTTGGSTTAKEVVVEWKPTQDWDIAVASIAVKNASLATSIKVADVEVYEGAKQPVGGPQEGGRGAMPPVGVIQAAASSKVNDSNIQASIGKLWNGGSFIVQETSAGFPENEQAMYAGAAGDGGISGSGLAQLGWWIDPSLIATPDDYAQGQLSIEFFWRGILTGSQAASTHTFLTNPRLLLWTLPEPVAVGEGYRYTPEYGALGKQVPQVPAESSLGAGYNGIRTCRIGTLDFPVTQQNQVRWLLVLTKEWSNALAAIFGTYELIAVPAQQRITLPTGKSRSDGTYPNFQPVSAAEMQKIVRANLRGQNRPVGPAGAGPGALGGANEGTGVSGSQMDQMPVNPLASATDLMAILHMEQIVPDDPSGESADLAPVGKATTHFSFTPRYRLARPS